MSGQTSSSMLSVQDLCIGLTNANKELVKGVSFDVAPGRILALVGESGSGKTMIGRSILRLLPEGIAPTSGGIYFKGELITQMSTARMRQLRGGSIGMVFQEPLVSLNPAIRIGKQMAEALELHTDMTAEEIRKRSIEMLRRIQIADPEACLDAFPHQFSGGMRQRIMLASVMLLKPELLIADEPTTALDTLSQLEVIETMVELTRDFGTSVLLITHNLGLVAKYAHDVVVLREGEVVEAGTTDAILTRPTHDYTLRLVESVPSLSDTHDQPKPVGDPVIEARNISLSFHQGTSLFGERVKKSVLKDVSLTIGKGEIVAIVGGSGSGKTTLGRAMLRLADIEAGKIIHKGVDITARSDRRLRDFRRSCQIVFQDPFSSLNPRMKVGAIVEEALRHEPGLPQSERRARALAALADVGLPEHAARFPHELSGGQRQRVAIARAVVSRPDLIVADEPISALDMTIQKQVLELFERLQAEHGFACMFISHDLAAVQQIAQRIIVMHDGQIVEEGSRARVSANPKHPYTRKLIAASPMLAKGHSVEPGAQRERKSDVKSSLLTVGALVGLLSFGPAQAGGELVVGLAGDLRSMYPAGSTEDSSLTVQQQIYEGLLAWKTNGEVGPMLATKMPAVSSDGLTYTFELRPGIKFHDGEPLTATAVANSWKFLLDPATGWGCRQYFNGTNSVRVTDISAVGDLEVKFTLADPAPELLTQMARSDCGETGIMAPAVYGPGKAKKPIGTGPFMVQDVHPGKEIVLVPYRDYKSRSEPTDGYTGKKEVLLDKLTFMTIPDPAANYSALLAGNIQVWPGIQLTYASQLKEAKGITLKTIPIPSINTLAMQTSKGPLTNVALRQAINFAMDRASMVTSISQGYAQPNGSLIPSSSPFYGKPQADSFKYDPAKVKDLLKKANYRNEQITLITNKNYSVMYDTGVMMQAMLQAAGLNVKLEVMDFATQLQKYYSGDYVMMTWNYAPTLDPALLLDRVIGPKKVAPSKIWDDPKARDLVNQLLAAPSDKRQPIYDEIQKLYEEDAPMLVWSSAQATDAYSNKVQGYETWAGRKSRFWGVSVSK